MPRSIQNHATRSATEEPGLEFIVINPAQRPTQAQKRQIRSHATRTRPRKQKTHVEMASWIARQPGDKHTGSPSLLAVDPFMMSSAETVTPYTIQEVQRFMTSVKRDLYPKELCIQAKSMNASWVSTFLGDEAFVHSLLCASGAYFAKLSGREQSSITHYHFLKALHLLQQRISLPDNPLAIADPTILAVVNLALWSETNGDGENVVRHVDGLRSMLQLRGGLGALHTSTVGIISKTCGVDISYSIRAQKPPRFLGDDISWERYLPDDMTRQPPKTDNDTAIAHFVESTGTKMANIWGDLRQFARIGRLSSQTDRKLPIDTYVEIMMSLLYRLLHLPQLPDTASEALRLGMTTVCVTLYFRMRERPQVSEMTSRLGQVLHRLRHSPAHDIRAPSAIELWLLVVWHSSTLEHPVDDMMGDWLKQAVVSLGITSWEDARDILKSVFWIDALHDFQGRQVLGRVVDVKYA